MSAVMGPYWPALAVVTVGLCWAVVGPVAKEEIKHRNVRMVVRVFESKKKNIPTVQTTLNIAWAQSLHPLQMWGPRRLIGDENVAKEHRKLVEHAYEWLYACSSQKNMEKKHTYG